MNQSVENQPYAPEIPQTQLQDTFSWAGLVSTVVVFILILCVVLWLVHRFSRKGMPHIQRAWLRVLDRQALSPQHNVYLVEVAGKVQIWGATDQQIHRIAEIEDDDRVAVILEEIAGQGEAPVEKMMGVFGGLTMGWGKKINGLWRRAKSEKKRDFSSELEKMMRDDDTF